MGLPMGHIAPPELWNKNGISWISLCYQQRIACKTKEWKAILTRDFFKPPCYWERLTRQKMPNLYLNLFCSSGVKTIIKTWRHSRNSGKRDRKQHIPSGILIICNPRISVFISVLLDQWDPSVPQDLWTSLTAASSTTTASSWEQGKPPLPKVTSS